MGQNSMKVPDSIDDLFAIFENSKPIDDSLIFNCKCCGARDYHDDMHGFQYSDPGEQLEYVYYCIACMDKETWKFVLENKIDVRVFTPEETPDIELHFHNGNYYRWLEERGQG